MLRFLMDHRPDHAFYRLGGDRRKSIGRGASRKRGHFPFRESYTQSRDGDPGKTDAARARDLDIFEALKNFE